MQKWQLFFCLGSVCNYVPHNPACTKTWISAHIITGVIIGLLEEMMAVLFCWIILRLIYLKHK